MTLLLGFGCAPTSRAAQSPQDLTNSCCGVVQEDVQEFHPYVFQIFAQLIELRSGALPGVYMQIFPPLLSPQFWERPGNVTPLVRLLQVSLFMQQVDCTLLQPRCIGCGLHVYNIGIYVTCGGISIH